MCWVAKHLLAYILFYNPIGDLGQSSTARATMSLNKINISVPHKILVDSFPCQKTTIIRQ